MRGCVKRLLATRWVGRRLEEEGGAESYHFGSSSYVAAFGEKPPVDVKMLRSSTVEYLEAFDAKSWHEDPVRTLLRGDPLEGGEEVDTVDAFGSVNGKQILATSAGVDAVLAHMQQVAVGKDFRDGVRRIEARLLSSHAAQLIGNQAMDFHKQDGVTEIEESIEANVVERKLNDLLLEDERAGRVRVQRQPALVGCVSNFSNFLDLCRKTLRNIELGVPVLVLSRSNTTQHMFRWTQLLLAELRKENIDTSLVSYLSCTIAEQRRVMKALAHCPLYLTGSREVAAAIKELMPYTFASTGGPNTMVAPTLDADTEAAIRMSSTIENSGQCTAMRHLVTESCSKEDLQRIFNPVQGTESAADSLRRGAFDGLFTSWARSFQAQAGYQLLEASPATQPVAYRIAENLTPTGLEENWRRVYLDVSRPPAGNSITDGSYLQALARWLTVEQPITLAVNGDDKSGFSMMWKLFESTAQAIYSVGRAGRPALTAQARPQDGEIFGEFPPRADMHLYTQGPVFVPSSTPSYMARYETAHLAACAGRAPEALGQGALLALLRAADEEHVTGYAVLLAEYLKDSCGPKLGCGQRTTLWGLQRPPLSPVSTILRLAATDRLAAFALHLLPFVLTNAKEGLVVSVAQDAPARHLEAARSVCDGLGVPCHVEDAAAFDNRRLKDQPWNTIELQAAPCQAEDLPMVDHFVLRLLPMGHIKSTTEKDEDFVNIFKKSPKWLRFAQ
ncbi:cscB [Symbiodinium natans]|uniref:CscB protein n=1 Tax=Symbiodinium natans TaxID=878477 RepID=A0A812LQ81_9DINO|nr:cscB [Symbiodinium natans]